VSQFVAAVGFGLVIASVLSVSALGFDLTFAVSRVLNIGFIAFMLLGQFVAYEMVRATNQLPLGVAAGCLAGGVLAFALYRILVQPFSRRRGEPFVLVLILFSFYTLMAAVLSAISGDNELVISESRFLHKPVHIAGMLFTVDQTIIIGCSFALVLAVDAVLRYSALGRDIRAIADNRELAEAKGVPAAQISQLAWIVSGALGGLAGVFVALAQQSFSVGSDAPYFVLVTAAAFVGGAGKPYGALLGALVIGLATQISALWIQPELSPIVGFLALVVTVMFRPGGILGDANEVMRA
jgi:branched-chain amino acid transport system permease protein/neutral amino acid transport system permease protein